MIFVREKKNYLSHPPTSDFGLPNQTFGWEDLTLPGPNASPHLDTFSDGPEPAGGKTASPTSISRVGFKDLHIVKARDFLC